MQLKPGEKKHKGAIKKKGKVTPLSRATKPRKDPAAVDIFAAVAKGSLPELEKTLKDNDLNMLNLSNETLLHVAAAHGHLSIVAYLLSKGARTGVKDRKGRTALHRAAEKGHGGAVKLLLRGGASTHTLDMEGRTPLHWAAVNHHSHIVKMLLKEEARNCRNQHTFLHMAALRDEKAGATVDSNTVERLALFRAVQKNQHSVVAALIDRGTDINSAEVLMEKGANLGTRTPAADTALHLAVQAGAASIAALLLSKGMDTNLRNQAEETPLHVAALRNHGALVGLLVSAGARINAVTRDFATPLHIASQRGHTDVAQQLLHHKAPVNAQDKQAKSPLHLAAEQGHKTLAEMLLKARADPNAQDKEKKTPLHTAALRGHLSIVELLLAKKGRAGAKDMDGCTPLHYATMKGNTDILKLLLASGKNKNINDRNVWRKTALHIAAEYGHGELINSFASLMNHIFGIYLKCSCIINIVFELF
uniref:Uncharacterized protein n=1 Tax=Geospiza parvula TaxID=87175 RepID=A0A8C3NLE2_GEOPR